MMTKIKTINQIFSNAKPLFTTLTETMCKYSTDINTVAKIDITQETFFIFSLLNNNTLFKQTHVIPDKISIYTD